MVVTLRGMALRSIAVIVLVSGMADYLAFDVGDPLAPMSAGGTPSFICATLSLHLNSSPPAIRLTDSNDDGCIGCAAGFTAHRIKLPVVDAIATTSALYILPPSGPSLTRIDPPPRA
jgi:hypothetical protein